MRIDTILQRDYESIVEDVQSFLERGLTVEEEEELHLLCVKQNAAFIALMEKYKPQP